MTTTTTTQRLVRSADRVYLDKPLALARFLERFGGADGSYTLDDLGPALTCDETESLADLLAAYGHHDNVDVLRAAHLADCDEETRERHTGGPCPGD